MRYITKLIIIGIAVLSLVNCVSSTYQVADEDGTRTILVSDKHIIGNMGGCNPTFMVMNAHDEWFIIDTYNKADNIRLYNELRINTTHLVQLYYDYYIVDVII